MPIIPKYDLDTHTQAAPLLPAVPPDMSVGPAYERGAQELNKISGMLEHRQDILDQMDGHKLAAARAVELENAWTQLQTAPLKTRPGAPDPLDSAEGGVDGDPLQGMPTTVTIPRSQTITDDWQAVRDAIDKKYQGLAGNRMATSAILNNAAFQQNMAMGKRVTDFQLQSFQHEAMASIDDQVDLRKRDLGRPENAPPGYRVVDGKVMVGPEGDVPYQSHRKWIMDAYAEAINRGLGHPDTLTLARNKALADLDHQRALQVMAQNPLAWNAATASGTNRWQDILTEGASDKLETQAIRRINMMNTNDERVRKQNAMLVEQNFEAALRKGTLTRDMIDAQGAEKSDGNAGTRILTAAEQQTWHKRLDEYESGSAWPMDNALRGKWQYIATSPNVTRSQVAEMRGLLGKGQLNGDFIEKYTKIAESTINQNESVGRSIENTNWSRVHQNMTTQLRPPAELGLKDPKDYMAYADASEDLQKWMQSGKDPVLWEKERLPFYQKDALSHLKGQFDRLNDSLGPIVKVVPNDKGQYTDEQFAAASVRLRLKYGYKTYEQAEHAIRTQQAPAAYLEDVSRITKMIILNHNLTVNKPTK